MFQLTLDEAQAVAGSRFQIGILKQGQNIKYLPFVFTQEGVAMLSSVLRSPRAVQVNIAIMRVFVRLRETLSLQQRPSPETHSTGTEDRRARHQHPHFVRRHPPAHDAARRNRAGKSAFTPFPRTLPIQSKQKPNTNETPQDVGAAENHRITVLFLKNE
jgi:phage regulator Rha-like protein